MIAVGVRLDIRPVSFSAIMDDPAFPGLFEAYRTECLVPDAQPQRAIYEAMEKAGALKCFAAYTGHGATLIGFVSVVMTVMPHLGKRLATIESIFVGPDYRTLGADDDLLTAAEQHTMDSGCLALTALPRVGSAFDKVLSHRSGYTLTHSQHTRWFR
jgi:hypothetical protein